MRQDSGTRLFPWLLSFGLLAAGSFGAVLVMAPPAARLPRPAAALPEFHIPAPLPPPAMPIPLQAPSSPARVPAPASDEVLPALVNNPIWQCEVNGQKIFADSPCGAGASIRPLNATNRMNPTPIVADAQFSTSESPYAQPYSEDRQPLPGNSLYVAQPQYWRRVPPRPARRGHPPEPHGGPRAHGL